MCKSFVIAALLVSAASIVAAERAEEPSTEMDKSASSTEAVAASIPTKQHALQHIEKIKPPAGVVFVGSADMLKAPAKKEAEGDKNTEQWLGGWGGGYGGLGGLGGIGGYGGWGGWGGWPGWGGCGPYRFGFTCGGVPGWAYPLPYWNLWGAGLYGGGCGLGMAYGGLYYC